jgi:hypothetical protein
LLVGQVHGRQMFFLACDPWGSCSIPRRGIIAVRWKSQATRDATASRPARAPNYWDRAMAFRAKRNGCLLRGNSVPYSVKLRVGLARPAADVRRGAGPSGRNQTRSPMQLPLRWSTGFDRPICLALNGSIAI